jgi:hypothetical protein
MDCKGIVSDSLLLPTTTLCSVRIVIHVTRAICLTQSRTWTCSEKERLRAWRWHACQSVVLYYLYISTCPIFFIILSRVAQIHQVLYHIYVTIWPCRLVHCWNNLFEYGKYLVEISIVSGCSDTCPSMEISWINGRPCVCNRFRKKRKYHECKERVFTYLYKKKIKFYW